MVGGSGWSLGCLGYSGGSHLTRSRTLGRPDEVGEVRGGRREELRRRNEERQMRRLGREEGGGVDGINFKSIYSGTSLAWIALGQKLREMSLKGSTAYVAHQFVLIHENSCHRTCLLERR